MELQVAAVGLILLACMVTKADPTEGAPHAGLHGQHRTLMGVTKGSANSKSSAYDSGQKALPQVALLFLVKGAIPNEPVWRAFFELAGKLQLQPGAAKAAEAAAKQAAATTVKDAIGDQPLHLPLETNSSDTYITYKLQHGFMVGADGFTDEFSRTLRKKHHNHRSGGSPRSGSPDGKDTGRNTTLNSTAAVLKQQFPCPEEVEALQQDVQRLLLASKPAAQHAATNTTITAYTRQRWRLLQHASLPMQQHKTQLSTVQDAIAAEQEQQRPQQQQQQPWALGRHIDPLLSSQKLFSVYVHTPAGTLLPSGSLFSGCELPVRLNTTRGYAQHVLAEAAVLLLRAALQDSANTKFVLVGDTSIPLYPPQVIWAQLMAEPVSRLDACKSKPLNERGFRHRWSYNMSTNYFTPRNWRKSWQWFTLSRPHALLAVADQHVREIFHRHCYTVWRGRQCVSDEHYLPSLLSSYGLDHQTDCQGLTHFADWRPPAGWHPKTFHDPEELTPALVREMRGGGNVTTCHDAFSKKPAAATTGCNPAASMATAAALVFQPLNGTSALRKNMNDGRPIQEDLDRSDAFASSRNWMVTTGYIPLRPSCPLFARKFPAHVINATLTMALSCTGLQLGSWCHT